MNLDDTKSLVSDEKRDKKHITVGNSEDRPMDRQDKEKFVPAP